MLSISPFLVIDDNTTSSMLWSEVFDGLGSYKLLSLRTKELGSLYDPSQHNVLKGYELSMSTINKAHLLRSINAEAKTNEHYTSDMTYR